MGNSIPSRKGGEESELTAAESQREGGARKVLSAPATADPSPASSPDGGAPPGTVGGEGHVADGTVKKKRICCACPETKKLRDECIALHGETSCEMLIEAHKRCLRSEGFAV